MVGFVINNLNFKLFLSFNFISSQQIFLFLSLKSNSKHIVLAILFALTIQTPYVFQLIHMFDNDHGIVYFDAQTRIQKISKNNCGIFHQQLHYVFNLETNHFKIKHQELFFEAVSNPTEQIITHPHQDFFLRAPPV